MAFNVIAGLTRNLLSERVSFLRSGVKVLACAGGRDEGILLDDILHLGRVEARNAGPEDLPLIFGNDGGVESACGGQSAHAADEVGDMRAVRRRGFIR